MTKHPIIPRRSQSPRVSCKSASIIPQETGSVIVQTTTQKLRGYDSSIDWKFSPECRIIILPRLLLCQPYRIFCSPRDPPIRLLGVKRRDQNASVFKTLIWKVELTSFLIICTWGPATTTRCYTHTSVCLHQHKTSNNIWQTSKVEEFIQIDKIRIQTRKWTLEKGSSRVLMVTSFSSKNPHDSTK